MLRDDLYETIHARLGDIELDEVVSDILSLPAMQELHEKARKWDRLASITEPLAITPFFEDWHDTWSTTCPCLPLVIGNVIVHIGGGCSFTSGGGEG